MSEIDLVGGKFTWERSRGTSAWVRERLDRAFAVKSWWLKFPLCQLKVLHTAISYHEPILLNLVCMDMPRRSFKFRFENMWLREPSYVEEVSAMWKDPSKCHLLPKLFVVSSFMARWGKSLFHEF